MWKTLTFYNSLKKGLNIPPLNVEITTHSTDFLQPLSTGAQRGTGQNENVRAALEESKGVLQKENPFCYEPQSGQRTKKYLLVARMTHGVENLFQFGKTQVLRTVDGVADLEPNESFYMSVPDSSGNWRPANEAEQTRLSELDGSGNLPRLLLEMGSLCVFFREKDVSLMGAKTRKFGKKVMLVPRSPVGVVPTSAMEKKAYQKGELVQWGDNWVGRCSACGADLVIGPKHVKGKLGFSKSGLSEHDTTCFGSSCVACECGNAPAGLEKLNYNMLVLAGTQKRKKQATSVPAGVPYGTVSLSRSKMQKVWPLPCAKQQKNQRDFRP